MLLINNFKSILIFIIFFITFSAEAVWQKQIIVKPATTQQSELFETFYTSGICKNDNGLSYKANVAGKIDFISEKQGSEVSKGDLIIAIDLKLAESILAKNQVSFRSAELSYNRDKALFLKKIISDDLLDKSRVFFEMKKNELEDGIKTYNNMFITAPFDGKIGVIKVRVGDQVNIGDELFTIISEGDQTIILEIPEYIYKAVTEETEVKIIDSDGSNTKAKIRSISQYISNNGTVTVKVSTKDSKFTHGSFVKAELTINKHIGLIIPEQAVLKNDNGNFIYKIGNDNIIKQVYVKLGTRRNDLIEVISENINLGDIIVLEGLTKVQEGSVVKILD